MTTNLSGEYTPVVSQREVQCFQIEDSHEPQSVVQIAELSDLLSHLLPKLERYVGRHYHEFSYDLQQELIQAGLTAIWEKARRDQPVSYDAGYWFTVAKFGMMRGLDALRLETGVWSKGHGTRIENRVEYACELAADGSESDGLELVERHVQRQPGPTDPEGGRVDQRLDFERLVTGAFALLSEAERGDCQVVAQFLALGEGTVQAFSMQHGWTEAHYKQTLNRLKEVFYQAAGKVRPDGRAVPLDQSKICALYQRGYGYDRIARLMGCSKARVQQIMTKAKQERLDLARLPRRVNQNSVHPMKRLVSAA